MFHRIWLAARILLSCFSIDAVLYVNPGKLVSKNDHLLICAGLPCHRHEHGISGCNLTTTLEDLTVRIYGPQKAPIRMQSMKPGLYTVQCQVGRKVGTTTILLVRKKTHILDCAAAPVLIDLKNPNPSYFLCVERIAVHPESIRNMDREMKTLVFHSVECFTEMDGITVEANNLILRDPDKIPLIPLQIRCAQKEYELTIRVIRSPNETYALHTNNREGDMWKGEKDLRLTFRLKEENSERLRPDECTVFVVDANIEKRIENGIFPKSMQQYTGNHKFHCKNYLLHLSGEVEMNFHDRLLCHIDCLSYVRQPKRNPRLTRMCFCTSPGLTRLKPEVYCVEDSGLQLNFSRGSLTLFPSVRYPAQIRFRCAGCWTENDCGEKQRILYVDDPPKRSLKVRLNSTSTVYYASNFTTEFSYCMAWTPGVGCNDSDVVALEPSCEYDLDSLQDSLLLVECKLPHVKKLWSFNVTVIEDRPLVVDCVSEPVIVDKEQPSRYRLCRATGLYGNNNNNKEVLCFSEPPGLTIENGILVTEKSDLTSFSYTVDCDGSNTTVLVYVAGHDVLLVSTPPKINRLARNYKLKFHINYELTLWKPVLDRVKPGQPNCTASDKQSTGGGWFEFAYDELTVHQVPDDTYTWLLVLCRDRWVRRQRNVTIDSKLDWSDLSLEITESIKAIHISSSPYRYTCQVRITNNLDLIIDPEAIWRPSTISQLTRSSPSVIQITQHTPEGVYSPLCVLEYSNIEKTIGLRFLVLSDASVQLLKLEVQPTERTIVTVDVELIYAGLKWYGLSFSVDRQILESQPRYCNGSVESSTPRKKDPIYFINYYPTIKLHTSLVNILCHCELPFCRKSYKALFVRLEDMRLMCPKVLLIDLEAELTSKPLCFYEYSVPLEWIRYHGMPSDVRYPAHCLDPTGQLLVSNGTLHFQLSIPSPGSYSVICANNTIIPVHMYTESLMLAAFPTQSIYFFGGNRSIEFQFVDIYNGTMFVPKFHPEVLDCAVVAPVTWSRESGEAPFKFDHSSLYLNVSHAFRIPSVYRVQCGMFGGVIKRTTEVCILRDDNLQLVISGPNTTTHDAMRTGVYVCELVESNGLDLADEKHQPRWFIDAESEVDVAYNTLIVHQRTKPGVYTATCIYDRHKIRIVKEVNITFEETKGSFWLKISPHINPIRLEPSGNISLSYLLRIGTGKQHRIIELSQSPLCSVTYREGNRTIIFQGMIPMRLLQEGNVVFKCNVSGSLHAEIQRKLVRSSNFELKCTDQRLIYVPKNGSSTTNICHYVNVENRTAPAIIQEALVVCKSSPDELKFANGNVTVGDNEIYLGFFDISCEKDAFQGRFFFYDDSLVLRNTQPQKHWHFGDPEKIVFGFGFLLPEFRPLDIPGTVANCRLIEDEDMLIGTFDGLEFILDLSVEGSSQEDYTVECGIFSQQIIRQTKLTLHTNDYILVIHGGHRSLHLFGISYVYTCEIVKNTHREERVLLGKPRWVSLDPSLLILISGNRLFIDTETDTGVHPMRCLFKNSWLDLFIDRSFIVCGKADGVKLKLQPEPVIFQGDSKQNVTAQLEWHCSNDQKIMDYIASLSVKCNVTYSNSTPGEPLVFTNSVPVTNFTSGVADFYCFNEENEFGVEYRRLILNNKDFELSCTSISSIYLDAAELEVPICNRVLPRVEPWISIFSSQDWMEFPVKCSDSLGVLNFTNGTLQLSKNNIPSLGTYLISCDNGRYTGNLTLYDSSAQLTMVPERNVFSIEQDAEVSFALKFTDPMTLNTLYLENIPLDCSVNDRRLEKVPGYQSTFIFYADWFGNISRRESIWCVSKDGFDGFAELLILNSNEVAITIIGRSHVIHEAGEQFDYICQVSSPPVVTGQLETQWTMEVPHPHIHLHGSLARLTEDLQEGVYNLYCTFEYGDLISVVEELEVTVVRNNVSNVMLNVSSGGISSSLNSPDEEVIYCTLSARKESYTVRWKHLYGEPTHHGRESWINEGLPAELYKVRSKDSFGLSTYACQTQLPDRCLSKLLIRAELKLPTWTKIPIKKRTNDFSEKFTCFTDAEPESSLAYSWQVILGDPAVISSYNKTISWKGLGQLSTRTYFRCEIKQEYMGELIAYAGSDAFVDLHHEVNLEFHPRLSVYREYHTLECRITTAAGFTSPAYMMLLEFPSTFQPRLVYNVIWFQDGFMGGFYRVGCYYISEHVVRGEIQINFTFAEAPRQLLIHEFSSAKGERFLMCTVDGEHAAIVSVNWTISVGESFAFEIDDEVLRMTPFALYGNYLLQCNSLVSYSTEYVRLTAEYNLTNIGYESVKDDSNPPNGILPFILITVCLVLCHVRLCMLLLFSHWFALRRSIAISFSENHEFYAEIDLSDMDGRTALQLRRIINYFNTIRQIMIQVNAKNRTSVKRSRRSTGSSLSLF
ncbi:hypothetical protein CLF_101468 [Clonorchis sinensis]|uniref:Ig-like domain-containing protein n=1 Tax=Clonorchis sinensis TaxID=79923 RepID=G7Y5T8_CLOSI|nr:hypothetical protein CLF_101468 [Clonorchis sinensis]